VSATAAVALGAERPRLARWARRAIAIPAYGAAWLVWIAAVPLWLPLAAGVDLARRNGGIALRCAAMLTVYLSLEGLGMLAAGGLWLGRRAVGMDDERWRDLHFRLEAWWGTTLFRAVVAIFGLRVEVTDRAQLGRGPYLLLLRHASAGDTLLASALVSSRFGMRLRYVLKRELLWDPSLDLVGNRIPNAFVDRSSDETGVEALRVRALASDLGLGDGVLIYPEGTRFSEAKRARLLERFSEKGDAQRLAYARSLTHVLPPRPGGTLGLMEAAPNADVVICSHTGFEGAGSLSQIWSGALLRRVVRVEFRRVPRSEIPTGRGERGDWLCAEWQRVDDWVARQREA